MRTVTVDRVMAESRAASFTRRSIKEEAKLQGLCMALLPAADMPDLPQVAAVCGYPSHFGLARELVADSGVHVASVATAFPSGQSPVNLLTGQREIQGIHAAGVSSESRTTLEAGAGDNMKRVLVRELAGRDWYDDRNCHSPCWIEPFVEYKTIWHPSAT